VATNLTILQGKTFSLVLRWEQPLLVYKAITGITKAGSPVLTVVGHGVPNGWRGAVVSVEGMTEINAKNWPLRDSDMKQVTVLSPDTIEFNSVNASQYSDYVSGGYFVYRAPVALSGFSARMKIKDRIGGIELASFVSPTDIVIDDAAKTITLTISATATAEYKWIDGVYDFEMVSGTGEVTLLLSGNVVVVEEVTT
jgi:hypothetical protein